jgi:tRNA-dihydrouridine synthase B
MAAGPLHLCLAPMRGVTGPAFRRCLARHFGGLDRAVAPFIATVAGRRVKPGHLAGILPAENTFLPVVPQAIGKSPVELRVLLTAIRELGHVRCDLNAGCPWPFVVRKGRGAGLLRDPGALRAMLDAGCGIMPGGFSVKTRLGIDRPGLLAERMAVLNDYPLAEVTIHPRTACQMYAGTVDLAAFGVCLRACRHPVVYNGDIRTRRDLERLRAAFPAVASWMIGRGVAADPFLPERLRGDTTPRDPGRLRAFLDDYLAESAAELSGPAALLGRLKELWRHLHLLFAEGESLWQDIRRCRRLDDYRRAVERGFAAAVPLREPADGIGETPAAGQDDARRP